MTAPTLTEFLLARIAEDDAAIRSGVPLREAECEAKRRIVALHPEMLEWCQGCASEAYPCRTLRALAAIYADHPDYREGWRP